MEEPHPETVLAGGPTSGELNAECDYCSQPAITLGDGMKLCIRHYDEMKPKHEHHQPT